MRHDKLERELNLILLLTENHVYTIDELCAKVGISRRNLYYYLEFFRDCGFKLYKRGNGYCIDRDSPFINSLVSRVSFTEDEAVLMNRLLDRADSGNVIAANLKKKLARFYDLDILDNAELREQSVRSVRALYDAIKLRRQAVLLGYASPHSRTVRDRFVEPFLLMNNNNEVRCYEPASGLNKTFKVSRMQGVEVLGTEWEHEGQHRRMFTDVFMFSGELLMPVELVLGELSYNVMKEEYPQAIPHIADDDRGRHLLRLDVCSYAGIGRFVLGLLDDIEVLGGDGFKDYLKTKVEKMNLKVGLLKVKK